MKCYCGSELEFDICCEPYLSGVQKPATAEVLMRSRYSAYVTIAVDYIMQTTHRSTRHLYNKASIEKWAKSSSWQRLEIISKQAGETLDVEGFVEFKAYYLDELKRLRVHHENSNFLKERGEWFFVDGKLG